MSVNVSLFVTVSDADESLFSVNFCNLINNSHFNFSEIILVEDRVKNTLIQDLSEEYLLNGLITSIVKVDYSEYEKITKKYSSSFYNYKGNYAYLYGLDNCSGDFIAHYDIDMLLYSNPDFSWITPAAELLDKYGDLFAVHPSPPLTVTEELQKNDMERLIKNGCTFDKGRGYRKYKHFSTRCFLVRKEIKNLSGLYVDETLEEAITDYLRKENRHRGEMIIPENCFILHSHNKWQSGKETLQKITSLINRGVYPASQLDRYDLDVSSYKELIKD